MSPEYKYKFLDIGGGPDVATDPLEAERLRGVVLARKNPAGEFYIVDPNLPDEDTVSQIRLHTPNVYFIPVGVDINNQLPLEAGTYDDIEMNFTFISLAGSQGNNIIDPVEFQKWLAKDITTFSEVPLFAKAIAEAARLLKEGGKLTICEKKQRMDRILKIFENSTQNPDEDFLSANGLRVNNFFDIIDERSYWARRRLQERQELLEKGDIEKAEESILQCLELIKI